MFLLVTAWYHWLLILYFPLNHLVALLQSTDALDEPGCHLVQTFCHA